MTDLYQQYQSDALEKELEEKAKESFEWFMETRYAWLKSEPLEVDLPATFDYWLSELSIEQWINYGEQYALECVKKELEINIRRIKEA